MQVNLTDSGIRYEAIKHADGDVTLICFERGRAGRRLAEIRHSAAAAEKIARAVGPPPAG